MQQTERLEETCSQISSFLNEALQKNPACKYASLFKRLN